MAISGGYNVMSPPPPPPSSGAVLLFILNVLNGFQFNAASIATVDNAVETFHRIIEAFKHGFALRTNFGDAEQEDRQFKINMDELIKNMTCPCWGEMKRDKITRNTHDTAYYEPSYYLNVKGGGTTNISVLGPNGDDVSVTSSINIYFGSKIVGSRTGILFNDVINDFSTPNQTDFYGIPASPANVIKPFKRPLSSMSRTIVLDKHGDVKLVTGGTGGSNIITAVAMNIIQTLWLKLGLKEAIDFPRIHHQLLPPEVKTVKAFPEVILRGLAERGHRFDIREKLVSTVQAIMRKKNKQDQNIILTKHIRQEPDIYSYSDPFRNGEPDGF